MDVKHGRGYLYVIEYHIAWCFKYKHKILDIELANYLKDLLIEIAIKHDFKIESVKVVLDHV